MDDLNPSGKPVTEHQAGVVNRLKRLQNQMRMNIPAILTNRLTSSFTLHQEPPPQQATTQVQVMVYPQDPFVGEPEIRHMNSDDIRPGLINNRLQIEDSAGAGAQPDADGNYLFDVGSLEFDQVNAFYYATITLRMYERYARRAIPWAFPSPRLRIDPHVGNDANAFYNEQERLLGFHTFKPTNGKSPISTAQSADIVSHETGHAVLDGIRDLYNESFGLGTTAFHESFGDMTAVLVALHDDSLMRRLLSWTEGDLRISNFITAIAEELTHTLQGEIKHTLEHTVYLRNALNTLTAVRFDALAYHPPEPAFRLGRQPHNYSRLFTGTFYDALVGVYDHLRLKGHTAHIALSRARDIMGRLLITAVECAPVGEINFHDMAKAFLSADRLVYQGEYSKILCEVFAQRGLGTVPQFEAFIAAQAALPDLRLPDTINTALASALYLEDTLIPALALPADLELMPLATYRNADGAAFMTYYSIEQMPLNDVFLGSNNHGAVVALYGGLTLAFDAENRLVSAVYRGVTAEDRHQTRVMVQDLIREGGIIEHPAKLTTIQTVMPQAVLLTTDSETAYHRLVKFPAIVDQISNTLGSFTEYLREWVDKDNQS